MYNIPIEQVIRNQITVQDYFDLMNQILMDQEETRQEEVQVVLDKSRMSIKDGVLMRELEQGGGICELSAVKDFLKDVTFSCVFDLNENCSAVTKFLQMVDTVSEVNFFRVMIQFCETQLGVSEAPAREPQRHQMQQQPQQSFQPERQPYQGGGENGETGVLSDDFWKQFEQRNSGGRQNQQMNTAGYQNQYANPAGYGNGYEEANSNGETGVLDPNFWQRISQGNQGSQGSAPQRQSVGRLVHAKTGNVTVINKENFWIGSRGEVDLKIEKDTVSRKHAQILVRQNHYFISDNGSTNKTYVEGKEIAPNASVELYNGMHVKFANEEYIFQL